MVEGKNMIQRPIFSIPTELNTLKISAITYPNNVAIHPMMGAVDCVNNMLFLLDQGTGSYPPLENGLQRRILHTAISPPLTAPYFSMASMAYWEQVGVYLHEGIPFRAERYF